MRVLVTRPEPGASGTAEKLSALGHQPVMLPLTETVSLEAAVPPDIHAVDAVAATSAQAFRHASPALLGALGGDSVFAVGAATAAAARHAGFVDVVAANGDAESLAALMTTRLKPGAAVAYLAGRVRTEKLEATLTQAGFAVTTIETYDTRARMPGANEIAALRPTVDAALVYSHLGARELASFAMRPDGAGLFDGARFLCLSRQVADGLDGVARSRILTAYQPNEESLLDLLDNGAGTEGG